MIGVFCSVIAGAVMSLQGVINTRLTDRVGIFEANVFVQGTAFLLSFLVMLIFGSGNLSAIRGTKWTYLLGGVLGLVITVTVILSIKGGTSFKALAAGRQEKDNNLRYPRSKRSNFSGRQNSFYDSKRNS